MQNLSAATVSSFYQADKKQYVDKWQNCGKQALVIAAIHRLGTRSAGLWTKSVQSLTKETTSPTFVGLTPKRSVKTQQWMWMNPTLPFTNCATSDISVTSIVNFRKTGQQAVTLDHHIFDDRNSRITRRLPPQPTVYLNARAHAKDYG